MSGMSPLARALGIFCILTLFITSTLARPLHRLHTPSSHSSSRSSPPTFNPFPTGVNISLFQPNIAGCEYPHTSVAVPQGCFALKDYPPLVGLFGDINVNSLSLTLTNPSLNIWMLGGYSDEECDPQEYVFGTSPIQGSECQIEIGQYLWNWRILTPITAQCIASVYEYVNTPMPTTCDDAFVVNQFGVTPGQCEESAVWSVDLDTGAWNQQMFRDLNCVTPYQPPMWLNGTLDVCEGNGVETPTLLHCSGRRIDQA